MYPYHLKDDLTYYHPNEITTILTKYFQGFPIVKGGKDHNSKETVEYLNFPVSFDIETSNDYYLNAKRIHMKCGYMWCFQININGFDFWGRTWDEFLYMLNEMSKFFKLSDKKRMMIYVHNLAFEFQFMRKFLNWTQMFALDERKPLYCVCDLGIEFRCSMLLTNMSLEKLGESLMKYKVKKLKGDLDYDKIRNSKTPVSDNELHYCLNDVRVVSSYIQEQIEKEGNISNIPLTATGYVRRAVRSLCFNKDNEHYMKKFMKYLELDEEDYKELVRCFQGGFTHANAFEVGRLNHDVTSYDFTSSYPTVLVSEEYPISKPTRHDIDSLEELEYFNKNFCTMFDIEFTNIDARHPYEDYISDSKCSYLEEQIVNNGRVVSAKKLVTTITNVDYEIIKRMYSYDSIKVYNFKYFVKGYLPKPIIESVLNFYEAKTTLKDVEGKEEEYMQGKANLNSIYGMMVTSIVRDVITYNNDTWGVEECDIEEELKKYNFAHKFLYYPWGVWCTAYARRNLYKGIMECKEDYIYSDTDSVKIKNASNHIKFIEKYNKEIVKKIDKCLSYYNIDVNRSRPKNKDGLVKQLGVWDFDGHYKGFKTLGAKRYMVEYDEPHKFKTGTGETIMTPYSLTISGLNKKYAIPYLIEESKKNNCTPFDYFNKGMTIPIGFTGKMTHTYIDEPIQTLSIDYMGNQEELIVPSGIHLEEQEFSLDIFKEFEHYLMTLDINKYRK